MRAIGTRRDDQRQTPKRTVIRTFPTNIDDIAAYIQLTDRAAKPTGQGNKPRGSVPQNCIPSNQKIAISNNLAHIYKPMGKPEDK